MTIKKLNFYAHNLPSRISLLLVFKLPQQWPQLYKSLFPVVWRHIQIPFVWDGHFKATIEYSTQLAFGCGQTDSTDIITPSYWINVQDGDWRTTSGSFMCGTGWDGEEIITSEGYSPGTLKLANESGSAKDVYLGLVKGEGINQRFEPIFLWQNISHQSCLTIGTRFMLTAYVVNNHQGTGLIRAELAPKPVWTQDFDSLGTETSWNLTYDKVTKEYTVKPAALI
ncbi:hypothetical protein FRC08_012235 [Ceratobasidium sp. 394]|nr:hypothetical protein FRC08_012235 [Ceratobasidium sp. 394]